MPKPIDRTLAEMWESYSRAVIPPGTSAAQILNDKFAFYGGASYVLDVILAIGNDDISEDAGIDTIERLRQELLLFAEQMEKDARVKPGN